MKTRLDAGNMTLAEVDETTLRILTPMFQMGERRPPHLCMALCIFF
jgi:hypothetical protein|eukprot:COSAG06_NODE_1809_length_8335_cov_2.741806_4_plen_46_part_00